MNYDGLTMGRTCSDGFPPAVADYMRKEAATARAAHRGLANSERHAATLESVAGYIAAVGPADQRVRALSLCQPNPKAFAPGPEQQKFIAWVASTMQPAVDNSDALHELVAVAIEDLTKRHGQERERLIREHERSTASLADVEALRFEAAAANETAAEWKRRFAEREQEIGELRQSVAFFKRLTGDSSTATSEAIGDKPPAVVPHDRKRVPDQPNVYARTSKQGVTTYSVEHTNPESGRPKFENVGESLEDAIKLRDELVAFGVIKPREAVTA